MFSIPFDTTDHSFCEGKAFGGPPEIINSFSSLVISLVGIHAYLKYPTAPTSQLYILFIFNGFLSFMYHYTGYLGWGIADRFTMVLIAQYSLYGFTSFVDIVCENIWTTFTIRSISSAYILFMMVLIGLHEETMFNGMFSLYLLFLVWYMKCMNDFQYDLEIPDRVLSRANRGIHIMLFGGSFWILTELFCNDFTRFMMGHAFWHIAISIGGYYVSAVDVYVQKKYRNGNVLV